VRFDNRLLILLLLPGGLLALLLWGIARLAAASLVSEGNLGLNNYALFFARTDYVLMLGRTMGVAALTTLISLALAYPVAYFISRYRGRRDLLLFLVILPWLVSLVVRTYGWIVLLGNRGVINGTLIWLGATNEPVHLMFNTFGVLVGMVHVFCPFMIVALLGSFLHLDKSIEEAAMSLGAGPLTTFRRVVLPLTIPGVMSGTILVYLMATGAVVTPLMLGGVRDALLGTQIYHEVIDMFDLAKAATIAVVLTVAGLVVVLPLLWIERHVGRNLKMQG
jgi:putative spermidine/putrescine transport system permease protein